MLIERISQFSELISNKVAVSDEQTEITYKALEHTSNLLAKYINSLSIKHKTVGLSCTRSINTIIAIVGIIKAGCRYVPVEWLKDDPHTEKIFNSVDCDLIIFADALDSQLNCPSGMISLNSILNENNTSEFFRKYPKNEDMYINFTSGSTGKSKGVVVKEEGVNHYILSAINRLNIENNLSYAYVSTFSADLGNTAVFLSLWTGGTIHIFGDPSRKDSKLFWEMVSKKKIDFLKTTPSHFQALLRSRPIDGRQLKYLLLGGEKFEIAFAHELIEKEISEKIYNHYGPTETTIGVTAFRIDEILSNKSYALNSVPIGKIWGELNYKIFNKENSIGELLISGPQVARGYYNDKDQTEQFFKEYGSSLFYKTGDLVKEHPGGVIEFVGRVDRQLKIRGYRIAPEQIEEVARKNVKSLGNIVFTIANNLREKLILSLILSKSDRPDKTRIYKILENFLPKHMLPDDLYIVDAFPITKNGKIDVNRLKKQYLESKNDNNSEDFFLNLADKRSPVGVIHKEWFNLFKVLNDEDNFFSLGADSIDAIQFLSKLQNQHLNIRAKEFLENPTLGGIKKAIQDTKETYNYQYAETFTNFHPAQHWYFDNCSSYNGWFNQSIIISTIEDINYDLFYSTSASVIQAHPVLRTNYGEDHDKKKGLLKNNIDMGKHIYRYDLKNNTSNFKEKIEEICLNHNKAIREEDGELANIILIKADKKDYIIFIVHHLAVDAVSWRLLIDEFIRTYTYCKDGSFSKRNEINSYTQWIASLDEYSKSLEYEKDREELLAKNITNYNEIRNEKTQKSTKLKNYKSIWISFSPLYSKIIEERKNLYELSLPSYILSKLVPFISRIYSTDTLEIDIENHGREILNNNVDISKTIGWFTSVFPVKVNYSSSTSEVEIIKFLKRVENENPKKGLVHGVSRYILEEDTFVINPEICFNFLGKFTLDFEFRERWDIETTYSGPCRNPNAIPNYSMVVTCKIINGRLFIDISYDPALANNKKILPYLKENINNLLGFDSKKELSENVKIVVDSKISGGVLSYIPESLKDFHSLKVDRVHQKYNNKTVFITGATGFLGAHLLKDVLDKTDWKIFCLVRNRNNNSKYLEEVFSYYFPNQDAKILESERVSQVLGDIGETNLGIAPEIYRKLNREVDSIINLAADVHLFKNVEPEDSINCTSIKSLIKLANEGKNKEIHQVSTLAVAGYVENGDIPTKFDESDLDIGQKFHNTYEHSKFISEQLLKTHQDSGGIVYIYRIGNITGHSKTGIFQKNSNSNRIFQMFKSYLLTQCIPKNIESVCLTHVDAITAAIVAIAKEKSVSGGTFNIDDNYFLEAEELHEYFSHSGINLDLVSFEEYENRLNSLNLDKELKILNLFWAKRLRRNIQVKKAKTDLLLKKIGVHIPSLDKDWFHLFLDENFNSYLPENTIKYKKYNAA